MVLGPVDPVDEVVGNTTLDDGLPDFEGMIDDEIDHNEGSADDDVTYDNDDD